MKELDKIIKKEGLDLDKIENYLDTLKKRKEKKQRVNQIKADFLKNVIKSKDDKDKIRQEANRTECEIRKQFKLL